MFLSLFLHNAFPFWNCLIDYFWQKKTFRPKKKKLKQIVSNKIYFFILKYGFCFEFFTKINHYKTFHGTWLNFWKLSWTIKLCICLTPGVCNVTIEHDCLFFGLSTNPRFFLNICTQKKARQITFIKHKNNHDWGKTPERWYNPGFTTWVKHFYLTFFHLSRGENNFWRYGEQKHGNVKLVISILFFFVFRFCLSLHSNKTKKRNGKKKGTFENRLHF